MSKSVILLNHTVEQYALAETFKTARVTMDRFPVVNVTLTRNGYHGRGECYASARFGWNTTKVSDALNNLPDHFDHADLDNLLEPGPARNAVDCAFWDLEAKENGKRAWHGLLEGSLCPIETMTTVSLMSAKQLKRQLSKIRNMRFIKLKVGGPGDLETVRLIRDTAPTAKMLVDANEGWTPDLYSTLIPELQKFDICMIEQPLKEADDHILEHLPRPIPVCADESFHANTDLNELSTRYDAINVKLDKVGGLSAALDNLDEAKSLGLQTVVGCMLGTSLAIAPGLLAAQRADFADLDAHLLCKNDRSPPLFTESGIIHAPEPALWG